MKTKRRKPNMKRIISLVLAVLLLVTITVPVVAADGNLGVSVSVVPVTISADGNITESSETITKDSIIMLKINFQNDTSAARFVQNAHFYEKCTLI